ncbi:MAG: citE [Actinomycetia bacterium]|nr:citE [Actinomycetes bacterium]
MSQRQSGGRPPRSYLFVPATRLDRVASAWASGCDAVIVDLEDAVGAGDKEAARTALAETTLDRPVHVRVNATSTPHHADDVAALRRLGRQLGGVVLPKAERGDDVAALLGALGREVEVVALVETAGGLLGAPALASSPGVSRLAFGAVDYSTELGVAPTAALMQHPRSVLAVASAAAGLPPFVDGPHLRLDDEDGLRRHVADARALGAGASLCIHPRQVAIVHQVLDPEAEVAAARALLAEAAGREGVFRWRGEMVDEPVLARARRLVAENRSH